MKVQVVDTPSKIDFGKGDLVQHKTASKILYVKYMVGILFTGVVLKPEQGKETNLMEEFSYNISDYVKFNGELILKN